MFKDHSCVEISLCFQGYCNRLGSRRQRADPIFDPWKSGSTFPHRSERSVERSQLHRPWAIRHIPISGDRIRRRSSGPNRIRSGHNQHRRRERRKAQVQPAELHLQYVRERTFWNVDRIGQRHGPGRTEPQQLRVRIRIGDLRGGNVPGRSILRRDHQPATSGSGDADGSQVFSRRLRSESSVNERNCQRDRQRRRQERQQSRILLPVALQRHRIHI